MICLLLFILGAVMGSFACCQARRLRARVTGKRADSKWSVCEKCGKRLTWYENVPVVSWILQRGKCRKCGSSIGSAEILAEVLMGMAFCLVFSDAKWGGLDFMGILEWGKVGLMMTILVLMGILAVYDGLYGELPVGLLWVSVVLAAGYAGIGIYQGGDLWSLLGGVGILAGTYLALYVLSREKLVGAGDWILCLAIALALGDWWLCLICMFVANLLASLWGLPKMIRAKKKVVHFGPFLVMAMVVVEFLAPWIGLVSF